ncbi:hypothetical protein KB879_31860 (plasmid) [Cupriavidus sp. KK10]|jgi:hypothetical protein|uniref:hypothetical protein n=1 Tax=Cupriavidus sp. KK10 TaxID=1478019 RepID=UPI001BA4FC79|nr:hypothetical protein [Cupriavidus sp. KK10]QUN32313.1 hypothetical protein KB879_31860 [Cupriavidus sp. KK10]
MADSNVVVTQARTSESRTLLHLTVQLIESQAGKVIPGFFAHHDVAFFPEAEQVLAAQPAAAALVRKWHLSAERSAEY